jgi:hypothetical protein
MKITTTLRACALAVCAAALAACGSTPSLGKYDNRAVTTISGDRAFANLLVGPVGITFELSKRDADDIAELRRLAAKARAAEALQQPRPSQPGTAAAGF